jgi:phosphoribosylformimino-5-aminoimidazole carboxamide ribonucleotide (ProFAR) isomerase
MRVGSTILIDDAFCVQSYGWSMIKPLGKLQEVIDSLEEYGCDEIAVIRPARKSDSMCLFRRDIEAIKSLRTFTPLSFGGGIRSKKQLEQIANLPVERLIFSSAFLDGNFDLIEDAAKTFGKQAIQCMLPLRIVQGSVEVFHSSRGEFSHLSLYDASLISSLANEIIVYDTEGEGFWNSFNFDLLDSLDIPKSKLVLTGGIGFDVVKRARQDGIASVLIENKVLHSEQSINVYKNASM